MGSLYLLEGSGDPDDRNVERNEIQQREKENGRLGNTGTRACAARSDNTARTRQSGGQASHAGESDASAYRTPQ